MNKRLEKLFASRAWSIWIVIFEALMFGIMVVVFVALLQKAAQTDPNNRLQNTSSHITSEVQ